MGCITSGGSTTAMGDAPTVQGNYRIEVSGWGLNDVFFVEKTDLLWSEGGEKKLLLHRALPDGTVIFVRLMTPETSHGLVPVAYQVENVQPMNPNGLCEMRLLQVRPRSKAHTRGAFASLSPEYSSKSSEGMESSHRMELEEVLHGS
jgi:hypothetical protein